jgi:flagellar biosynthesis/type III secretory pathway chaperone
VATARSNASPAALRRILQQQLSTGRALVALAERCERALIQGDTQMLDTLGPAQRSLLEQQAAQEAVRRQVTAELAGRLGLETVPTLSELQPSLPQSDADALSDLRDQILAAARRMDALNQGNSLLLANALEFVKFSLGALTTAALKPARYGVNFAQIATPSFYVDSKA